MIEYSAGDPQYVKQPDTRKYADGENGSYIPMYQVDLTTPLRDLSICPIK